MTLRFGERHLLIESDTCTVLSFLLDGQYLDYNAATPKTHTTLLHVNASEIADCIDRVSVWSNETIKAPLDLKVSATETECSMSTSIGASSDSVQTTAEGDDSLHIRFNGSFLSEALRAIGNQPTCIGMQGHSRPAKLWGKETPDTYYIVLPVRMRETEATV